MRRAFPLNMREELEVPVNRMGFVIGVNRNYPARLREMISAAAITYQLQNQSIDHVRRTYLKDLAYEEDEGGELRFDRGCKTACLTCVLAAHQYLKAYPSLVNREPLIGEWISDLTLVRVQYSFERGFAEADKGALFEAIAIGRMLLEQICWVHCVRSLDDVKLIERKSATRSVGEVNLKFPIVGRLYGWLSDHAHWAYSAHLKAITEKDDQSAAMFSSCMFKAIAYAMLITLTDVYRAVVRTIVRSNRSKSLSAANSEWNSAERSFMPRMLLRKIFYLADKSEDVFRLMEIMKDRPRYG